MHLKKKFTIFGIILVASLLLLAVAFGVHCVIVNRYNAAVRTITTDVPDESGVAVSLHPRGQSTDKWDKVDDELGATVHGIIYEGTITNSSADSMPEWTLTIDVGGECFVNNAWCGTLEIHQKTDSGESVQTVDLRNCDRDSLTLAHHISGNDVMIELPAGSTIVYHPSSDDGEIPVESGNSFNIGIIFYGYDEDVELSGFSFEYKLHRNYLDSTTALGFLIAIIIWAVLLLAYVLMLVTSLQYEKRLHENDRLIRESLDVFTNFVDAKDPYTKGHSSRVAKYSSMIAERLGFSEDRCKQVHYIAMLHDIGKCYVPDEILKKPSRLTDEEFDIIKTHTTRGAEMVKNFSSISDIRDGALYHHERYDGRGYPTGKKGEDIPLIGRIICVADSYDAMNSSRVYRKRLPRETIISELERNRGTQFDPKIADVFLEILKTLPEDE